ncbi:putative rRNA/ tRNA methylase [Cystobacter fuscus DSM 2262]|uniref:rRNA/ tRNA methylase n=1 Tax=Cystobacter fuscus (strain ATCC 25194 / DSM 2262 / NBRC 100088 / M29) TaxID=1242864 RepID=S9QJK7_CYSF2|nr:class I SAM-dependent methyltransferase [Cystobacter fuscus]EPX61479.1 putative rRNA/ tRNA methylase [Cystobacter fuscus DSM 2262]
MTLDQLSAGRFGHRIFEAFASETSGPLERLQALRRELDRAGYREDQVTALLGLPHLLALQPEHFHYYDRWVLPTTPLADLVRLFLLDLPLGRSALEAALSPDSVNLLLELGVIVPSGEQWHSQVHLYCFGELLLATDTGRYSPLWPEGEDLPDRVMYIGYDSVGLGCAAPRSPSRRTLDLCCGSGIQGLVAAHYSEEVIGVDINPRAVRFSRFNAALNGIRNARFVQGDLFEPVRGTCFDRILANPPFVPQPPSVARLLYRDGGPTGEDLLRRLFQEGPRHLNEGGVLSITTDIINLGGLEERILSWSEGTPPLDVLVLVEKALPIAGYVEGHSRHLGTASGRRAHVRALLDHFQTVGITTLHGGYLIARHLPQGTPGAYQILDSAEAITHPVAHHVETHFRSREALRGGACARARVGLAEGIRFQLEVISGPESEVQRVQIVVPGDDFFPPLEISEGIHQLLRYVRKNRPPWSALATENSRPVLEELLLRGVLELHPPG